MIAVADTSPLNYLVQMGKEAILREILWDVIIPPAVLAELRHEGAPELVRSWAFDLPGWITVSGEVELDGTLPALLGRGESEAISLAVEVGATFILIQASERGLLRIRDAILELKVLGFRMSAALEERARGVE